MTTLAEHPASLTADGMLVSAHFAGDAEAFPTLYRRYHPDVLRFLRASLHDRAVAEDLAQEALLRALRYLHCYDPSKPFWPWLRKIAVNLVPAEMARRAMEVPVEEIDRDSIALADATDHVVSRDAVMECLATLPKRQSRALIMRYVEDRDANDIAALFGIKRNALEQLLLRARQNFLKEYRARNAALPGFAAIVDKLRRAFTTVGAKLNVAAGAPMSVAGDWAVGAVITVGGIGLVGGMGTTPPARGAESPPVQRPATDTADPTDSAVSGDRRVPTGVSAHDTTPARVAAAKPVTPVAAPTPSPAPEAAAGDPAQPGSPTPGGVSTTSGGGTTQVPTTPPKGALAPVEEKAPKSQGSNEVPVADVEMTNDPDAVDDGGTASKTVVTVKVGDTEVATIEHETHLADNNLCTAGPCLLD